MANHKSAAKRARQSVRKTSINSRRKSIVRTVEKNLLKALSEKNITQLPQLLVAFTSQMMKAAQRGVFKKETASRKISRHSSKVASALATN